MKKIKLQGFNNLTKSLSFNLYDICYTESKEAGEEYLQYIHNQYNAEKIEAILIKLSDIIGAKVLNSSKQDFDPIGSSASLLIAEGFPIKEDHLLHLDKSHCSAHTYPESNQKGIATFRVDVDVATCGEVSPLSALNFLINNFECDVLNIDYRIRGFTRDEQGRKIFSDHKINSITDFISEKIMEQYHFFDVNIPHENIFHSKLKLKNFDLDDYLFNKENYFNREKENEIDQMIQLEIEEIFNRKNIK